MNHIAKKIFESPFGFKCEQCGNCCSIEGAVFINEAEKTAISLFLKEKNLIKFKDFCEVVNDRFKFKGESTEPCMFYSKESGCVIYPVRPVQCQTFPVWLENLLNDKYLLEAAEYCTGLKRLIEKEKYAENS